MMPVKKLLNSGLIIGLFLFIVIYAHSRTAFLSQGADLEVSNIENGQTITEPVLEITGVAKRATKLTINGKELPIDEFGNFTNTLLFSPGLNLVEIIAEDKYGKGDTLTYEILYQEEVKEGLDELLARKQTTKPASPPPPEPVGEIENLEATPEDDEQPQENEEILEESLQEPNTI
jgi:hypothetical protein